GGAIRWGTGCSWQRRRTGGGGRGRRAAGLVREVDEGLIGRLLCLRVPAVDDVRQALAVDGDADVVEQRTVGRAADDPVRADLAVVGRLRIRDGLLERR